MSVFSDEEFVTFVSDFNYFFRNLFKNTAIDHF